VGAASVGGVSIRTATRPGASIFDRLPAPGLVLVGIASVQVGAAFATKLFPHLGPAGTVLLRVVFAAAILWAIWRPRPRAHGAAELRLAALFGLSLALMNLTVYEALDRRGGDARVHRAAGGRARRVAEPA